MASGPNSLTLEPSVSIHRRHDLDALRAVAMLLGIALHGAISFIPLAGLFWGVQDVRSNDAFGVFLAAIHGFRMPLFFLVSGFFTAMLWRRRGLKSLLGQRFKRIFLPLVIAMLTITPANWIVNFYVRAHAAPAESADGSQSGTSATGAVLPDLWAAAATDNVEALKTLIDQGADVNAKSKEGSTALHTAVFFGHPQAAKVLLDAGARTDVLDPRGQRPADLLNVDWGITQFVGGMYRLELSQEELQAGRREIAELLGTPLDAQVAQGKSDIPGLGGLTQKVTLAGVLQFLMIIPLFGHLWFLWFLCWLVMGFALWVTLAGHLRLPQLPAGLVTSGWRYAWLLPLTAIPQYFMGRDPNGFGPATSIGLLPMPSVLAYYAIFFGVGVLYFDADDREGVVGRRWWLALGVALVVLFPVGLWAGTQDEAWPRAISIFCQVAYAWLGSFGMMGLFRRWLSHETRSIRYLSDASYWMYLAHIPLVVCVQYWVRDWPITAWVKFPFVCLVTSLILLASYQLFVRYTPLGTLLNGRRVRPSRSTVTAQHTLGNAQATG